MSGTDAHLPVGSVLLQVASEHGPAMTAVRSLMEGYAPAPPPRGARKVVRVEVGTTSVPGDDLPVHGVMRPVASGGYVDCSQPWEVRVDGLDTPTPTVSASMRPVVSGADLWFQGVRKLLRSVASMAVVEDDSVLVHGCAMAPPASEGPSGGAFLFLGASGAGKTTMTRRLPGWTSLADDAVLLRAVDGAPVTVAGTPFPGKESLPRDGQAHPLAGIVVLVPHAARLQLEPVAADVAFQSLLERVFCLVEGGPLVAAVLDVAARAVAAVPAYRLHSGLEHDVAPLFVRSTSLAPAEQGRAA